jgi:hypothetical protein
MSLREACLARQQGDAEGTSLDPAKQFQAEPLMHLRKVHCGSFATSYGSEKPHISFS